MSTITLQRTYTIDRIKIEAVQLSPSDVKGVRSRGMPRPEVVGIMKRIVREMISKADSYLVYYPPNRASSQLVLILGDGQEWIMLVPADKVILLFAPKEAGGGVYEFIFPYTVCISEWAS